MHSGSKIMKTVDEYAIFSQDDQVDPGQMYDKLAKTYEEDIPQLGYYNHIKCHAMVEKNRPEIIERSEFKILDLACGTGWVAELLFKSGYTKIDGIDASPEMMKIAEAKKLYSELHVGYLGNGTFPEKFVGVYDFVTLSGALNKNHAPPEALDDVFEALKPKGIAVFTIPDKYAEDLGYLPLLREKEQAGVCQFVEA